MRSSKSRSRSKQNRPRTLGNIINRVFDSSGPEGKVRGTPQQIIEKYQILARDAQLSNDRVAHENFMQHAEHYTRMLGEAMREMAAEQEQRRPDGNQQGQPRRDDRDDGGNWQQGNGGGNGWQGNRPPQQGNAGGNGNGNGDRGGERRPDYRPEYRGENRPDNRGDNRGDYRPEPPRDFAPEPVEVTGFDADGDAGLVETPEARAPRPVPQERAPRPAPERQAERQRAPEAAPASGDATGADPVAGEAEAEGTAKSGASRRSRGPRKPRASEADTAPAASGDGSAGPREAAE